MDTEEKFSCAIYANQDGKDSNKVQQPKQDSSNSTEAIQVQQGAPENLEATAPCIEPLLDSEEYHQPISVRPINLSETRHLQQLLDYQDFISEPNINMSRQCADLYTQGYGFTSGDLRNFAHLNASVSYQNMRTRFHQYNNKFQGSWVVDKDEMQRTSSARTRMSLKKYAIGPPPLCSVCNNVAPKFGQPPIVFSYAELEKATSYFSSKNYLAEGGFGFVYKGTLVDGQHVAVKQHKFASSQGDMEFCSEVDVLSCAQHRNVVKLIGYCLENGRQLLVYEYVCNASLDWHLSSSNPNVLEWKYREKIAVGAARGLRYLHEEVRVGCIVHRDLRPNNILLTHDFTPMVGDFGLARWQPDANLAVETRVIGTLGYLAPEYAETGHITDKADVYSFGVVLLELITGRKAIDPCRPKGQQCLTEWARPLLEVSATYELVDPRLQTSYNNFELYCMVHAASLCIEKEPTQRPHMRQVLRILEGSKETINPRYTQSFKDKKVDIGHNSNMVGEVAIRDATTSSSKIDFPPGKLPFHATNPQVTNLIPSKHQVGKPRTHRNKSHHHKSKSTSYRLSYVDMLS